MYVCHPFAISLPVSVYLPSGHGMWGSSCGDTGPLGMFPFFSFLKWTSDVLASRRGVIFQGLLRLGDWLIHPNSERSTFLPSGQLQTNFHNTYTVQGVWASGDGLSWVVYGMQRCASNYLVSLYQMFRNLWCPSVCGTYLTECFGEGTRLEMFRSTSVPFLTGSKIRGFS